MESLAVLSVVCNVIQVVDFGLKSASLCKQIYEHGSSDEFTDLQISSSHLKHAATDLQKSIDTAFKPITSGHYELWSIAQKCLELAQELHQETERLTRNDEKSWKRSILLTIKTVKRKPAILAIIDKLSNYQTLLQTRLLVQLFDASELATIEQHQGFEDLGTKLQFLIRQLQGGHTQLSALIQREEDTTRGVIIAQTKQQTEAIQNLAAVEARRSRLLSSLKADVANSRRNDISEAHEGTFQWIFRDNLKRSWDSFSDWLKNGDGIYWINGKPGAGKSTLMKFLVGNTKTIKILEEWSSPNEPLVLTFFFWNAGVSLERNSKGLLCSLLYQLCQHDQDTLDTILLREQSACLKDNINDWSVSELSSLVFKYLSAINKPVCIFLDGIDEFDRSEGLLKILALIKKLSQLKMLKLCLSSRPEPPLQQAFQNYPQLKIQDLTEADIRSYVQTSLDGILVAGVETEKGRKTLLSISDLVIEKSEGVFLWAHLAITSLQRGATQHDTWDELRERLKILPNGLHELYTHMWNRLNEDRDLYRVETAKYFKFLLEWPGFERDYDLPVLLLTFAMSESDEPPKNWQKDWQKLDERCDTLRRRLLTRCAGLVEVRHSSRHIFHVGLVASANRTAGRKITDHLRDHLRFIHRSARDYLLETELGLKITSYYPGSIEDVHISLFKGYLSTAILAVGNYRSSDRERFDAYCQWSLETATRIFQGIRFIFQQRQLECLDLLWHAWHRRSQFNNGDNFMISKSIRNRDTDYSPFSAALDFEGLAAEYACTAYVRRSLEQYQEPISQEYLDYLLLCGARAFPPLGGRQAPHLYQFQRYLLRLGANPNTMGYIRIVPYEKPHAIRKPIYLAVAPLVLFVKDIHFRSASTNGWPRACVDLGEWVSTLEHYLEHVVSLDITFYDWYELWPIEKVFKRSNEANKNDQEGNGHNDDRSLLAENVYNRPDNRPAQIFSRAVGNFHVGLEALAKVHLKDALWKALISMKDCCMGCQCQATSYHQEMLRKLAALWITLNMEGHTNSTEWISLSCGSWFNHLGAEPVKAAIRTVILTGGEKDTISGLLDTCLWEVSGKAIDAAFSALIEKFTELWSTAENIEFYDWLRKSHIIEPEDFEPQLVSPFYGSPIPKVT